MLVLLPGRVAVAAPSSFSSDHVDHHFCTLQQLLDVAVGFIFRFNLLFLCLGGLLLADGWPWSSFLFFSVSCDCCSYFFLPSSVLAAASAAYSSCFCSSSYCSIWCASAPSSRYFCSLICSYYSQLCLASTLLHVAICLQLMS